MCSGRPPRPAEPFGRPVAQPAKEAPLNILSIQSWVSTGHVGNAAAMFPLQRLGAEVWAIHTVQFSNHTGHGRWTGRVFPAGLIGELARGMADLGRLRALDAVLSGYLGAEENGRAVLEAVALARQHNPCLIYCCDPVMGDTGRGLFVGPGIPALLGDEAVPAADILTPNQFELELLTGRPCDSHADLLEAVERLRSRMRASGPRLVLVTSVATRDSEPDSVELLAASPTQAWLVSTPRLPLAAHGAGDLTAAVFLFHVLAGATLQASLEATASSVWGILEHTARAGAEELSLVAAQSELVRPACRFSARQLSA